MNDTTYKLWAADAHQFGPGKIHIVDDRDDSRTMCGRFLSAVPGETRSAGKPTCKICLDRIVARPERERQSEQYRIESELRQRQLERERDEENKKWWAWYSEYLTTAKWKAKHAAVMRRPGGMCEGCGLAKAAQVHHTTYKHVGNEFLWELVAICMTCHEFVTQLDRESKSGPVR